MLYFGPFGWFFKKSITVITPLRTCSCGAASFSGLRFSDAVNCNSCGLIYYIGPDIVNPIARIDVTEA